MKNEHAFVCIMGFLFLAGPGSVFAARVQQQNQINAASDDTAFEKIGTAGFENITMEKDEGEWCNPFSRWSPTSYYFQEAEPDGTMTAYTLEANKESLHILVHKGQEWELEKDFEGKIQWVLTGDAEDQAVDFLEDVRYIRFMPEILESAEDLWNQEKKRDYVQESLALHTATEKKDLHGSYLPRKMLEKRFQSMADEELEDLNAQIAKVNPQRTKAFKKTVGKAAVITGVVGGATTGATAAAAVLLSYAIAGSFGTPVASVMLVSNMAFLGGLGAVAGAAVLGGATLALGGAALLYKVLKTRKQMQMSAAEKVFNAIKCHKTMYKCSRDILVPAAGQGGMSAKEICAEASKTP